ncbi:hypothetical protein CLOP_g14488 [Closterium sp. NIES-67]|nr:hypothetical protein CLOP_g14488 [Closterium sp. NIES-67]
MVHQTTALSPHLRLTASFCASRSRRTLLPPPIAGTEWLHAANKGCLIATGADSRIPVSHFQVSGRALHAASDTLLRIRPCAMARGEEGSSKVGAEGGVLTQNRRTRVRLTCALICLEQPATRALIAAAAATAAMGGAV